MKYIFEIMLVRVWMWLLDLNVKRNINHATKNLMNKLKLISWIAKLSRFKY